MQVRRPRGYVGSKHETIGSDVQAVLQALNFPRNVLGAEAVTRIESMDPAAWYPIQDLLDLMETLDQRLGNSGLHKLGRALFKNSHEERVKSVIKSARDVVFGIDGMYRHANRGQAIGGWHVHHFAPGHAELDKTTPHHCAMEDGILMQALSMLSVTARIEQPICFRRGDEYCRYVISSDVRDLRWDHEKAA